MVRQHNLRHPLLLIAAIVAVSLLLWTTSSPADVVTELGARTASTRDSESRSTSSGIPLAFDDGHGYADFKDPQSHIQLPTAGTFKRILRPEEAFSERSGLLVLQDVARPGVNPSKTVEHPILYLIRSAKLKWKAKLESQSKNLRQAVATYRWKYGRAPPEGFDRWFQFAKENGVILLDDFDQINRDILPFLGMPSKPLQDRAHRMVEDTSNYYYQGSFTMHIKDGRLAKVTGGEASHSRVAEQTGLIQRFVHLLPDMNVTIWVHDTPVMHMSGEKREELEELAKQGKTLPEDRWEDWGDPAEFVGWEAFCGPSSRMRNAISGLESTHLPDPSFIVDHYLASDFCHHPANAPLHSLSNNYGVGPRAVLPHPLFSHSKTSLYADILVTPLEQYDMPVGLDPDWKDKNGNKFLWRGSTTGSRYDRGIIWRSTQRVRLALLTNSDRDDINRTVYTTASDGTTLHSYDASLASLNPDYFDVLFTGEPLHCTDGACEAMLRHLPFAKESMAAEEANTYKYVLDVDGNGWSGRFHRLMSSKAAVLKSQGYIEWWTDRIQPWVHYIPIKLDYSDLHSVASFFIGDAESPGHDALAREIGLAGKDWAGQHWRRADMEATMFRLYLEYARVMGRDAHDPHSMDYVAL